MDNGNSPKEEAIEFGEWLCGPDKKTVTKYYQFLSGDKTMEELYHSYVRHTYGLE